MNQRSQHATKARYVMIGGFLGAGKTTSVIRLAHWLSQQGLRVGLITNDQGNQLVDTTMLAANGFPVREIPGGCFCCRFNSLLEAARHLSAESRPDVFITEPVGSCTDLVATVSYPLRRIYGESCDIAPLSVLVDPVRALRMFGLEAGPRFSDQVQYIYRKQLEEADLIVINKCDLLDATRLATLHQALARDYPQTARFEVSARQGAGLEPWFDHLLQAGQSLHASMEMDYELYAAGEARLGWLNCTLHLVSSTAFDGNATVQQLAEKIQRRLSAAGAEIAHLKMTLEPDHGLGDLAVINLVRNDLVPELSHRLLDPLLSGHLIINLRAETTPELLQTAVVEAVEECDQQNPALIMKCEHMECFQPSKPAPTHRIEN